MGTQNIIFQKKLFTAFAAVIAVLIIVTLIEVKIVKAQEGPPLHPTFSFLDSNGEHVLDSGQPLSTMETCGQCHDTEFIAGHSFHSDVGLNALTDPRSQEMGQPWDISPGLFGKWNPLTYSYLSPQGDERIDLSTADWVMRFGGRHVGSGPAEVSRDGNSLLDLKPDAADVQSSHFDSENRELVPWDWQQSGIVEMNCFLCHWVEPDNEARIETLQNGDFQWANSVTLLGSGIITAENEIWQWNEAAFDSEGNLVESMLKVKDPSNENCGLCHGLVHIDPQTPTVLSGCSADQWSTITTGQIMSPQKINQSGLNIENKSELSRSWDIHTERVVECTDCHYALNNPIYYQETDGTRPDHLLFDPRRIDLGEYLYRPLHQFAKGQSSQGSLAPQFNNSLRRCDSCHETTETHEWLPYTEQHMAALSCESCHVPTMYAPARESMDWTVLKENGEPVTTCRGVEGEGPTMASVLITGFDPILLQKEDSNGNFQLAPHNLISSWFWVYGDQKRPVPFRDLQMAWFNDQQDYHPQIIDLFDTDGDGRLDEEELLIDTPEKETLIASQLSNLGLKDPHIQAETRPYSISHNVTHGEWAVKECSACHSEDSRLAGAMLLSERIPGNINPIFVNNQGTGLIGEIFVGENGKLIYQTQPASANLYVLGHNNERFVDIFGAILFVATLLGVFIHAGLRFVSTRKNQPQPGKLREVYMYSVYERLWHWLQTAVILILLFTGLVIHKPDIFAIFSFPFVVEVHNIMAALLIANAALAFFYNVVSGQIKQYLPQPRGFFNQAFSQAKYYLVGIFKGEEHPFQKTPRRKMNPLQQITYLGLLNILLPLQIITGALMWGAQQWPQLSSQLGGLPLLAPFHTLISWLLASFIVMHVYLTTTGPTPTANIEAMIMGWDEIEVPGEARQPAAVQGSTAAD